MHKSDLTNVECLGLELMASRYAALYAIANVTEGIELGQTENSICGLVLFRCDALKDWWNPIFFISTPQRIEARRNQTGWVAAEHTCVADGLCVCVGGVDVYACLSMLGACACVCVCVYP